MKETAVVFITLLLLLTIISIFGGAMKPAQSQAPQNNQSYLFNAHEGYTGEEEEEEAGENYGGAHEGYENPPEEDEEYVAHIENMQMENDEDENDAGRTGVMPFVSEEFASF